MHVCAVFAHTVCTGAYGCDVSGEVITVGVMRNYGTAQCTFWELILCSLGEQQVLLTMKPFLWSLKWIKKNIVCVCFVSASLCTLRLGDNFVELRLSFHLYGGSRMERKRSGLYGSIDAEQFPKLSLIYNSLLYVSYACLCRFTVFIFIWYDCSQNLCAMLIINSMEHNLPFCTLCFNYASQSQVSGSV